ncbi:MAG: aldehyde ferredoxin oxidoreductase family protein [Bacillota bacterium]|nr:aldehyde ferredoxin oxidoreductase family protein [Bacillota bacterium]
MGTVPSPHFNFERFHNYDALIIEGKADTPVYLSINKGKVSFRSAEILWGTKTFDCQQIVKDELRDQNIRVVCIGPAGENLSKIACIINERRAVGRKGLGAVMGSKNLKAIAVRGDKDIPVADEKAFKEARSVMNKAMKESHVLYPSFSHTGTPAVMDLTCELGIFATKNWSATGQWAPVEKLGVEANTSRKIGREHCHNCPVGCSQMKLAREGSYAGTLTEGPEFESIYSLGGQTGVDNIDAVIAADRLCDELGVDTMSAGVAVGFAMELFERGILTKEDTDGVDLSFGNDEAMMELLLKIAYRRGLGGLLSDGVKAAAAKIGKGAEKYAMHIKGLELPAYDVRGAKAHGLNYATSYTGADHNRGYAFQEIFGIPVPEAVDRFAIEGKGKLTKWNQDLRCVTCDCATMCAFILDMALPGIAAQNTADLMTSLTGLQFTAKDVETVGERVNNLAKVFNMLAGFSRADDTFPERILTEPLKEGNSKGQYIPREDLNIMLDEYYEARGWTKEGVPTEEKLLSLGLENAIAAINKK